jgi:hypothetical protein
MLRKIERMNMRKLLLIVVILLSTSLYCESADTSIPEFENMQSDLQAILNQYESEYEVILDNNDLTIKYNTDNFMIHSRDKTGYISPNAIEKEGPNYNGFLIKLSVQDGQYSGVAMIPQTLKKPYWKTFINAYPLSNNTQYIWCSFSYGVRTNKELIEEVVDSLSLKSVYISPLKNEIIEK